jgi:hypothetical protein
MQNCGITLTEYPQKVSGKRTLECLEETLWKYAMSFDPSLKERQHE